MWIAIVIVVVVVLGWYILTLNSLAQAKVMIEEAFSDIDVQIEKKYEVLKQSFNAANNYATKEQKLLIETIKYRKGMTVGELSEVNTQIDKCESVINAIYENYPDLKAGALYANLQTAVSETEEDLSAARRIFNNNVSYFNQMIVSFPSSIIANMKHYEKEEFFKASEVAKAGFEIPAE